MQNLQIIFDCISRWQVEIITVCFLIIGQYMIRKYYSQKGKYQSLQPFQSSSQSQAWDMDIQKKSLKAKISYQKGDLDQQETMRKIKMLVKEGKIDEAEAFFNTLRNPSVQIYTILLKGYTKQGDFEKSTALLQKMNQGEQKPNIVTFNTYLTCTLKCKQFEVAQQVFDAIQDKDIISYSTYILGMLKNQKFKEAMELHEFVYTKTSLRMDQLYFNVLITGLLKYGKYEKAYQIYDQMLEQQFEFSEYSISAPFQMLNKASQEKINEMLQNYSENDKNMYSQVILLFFKSDAYVKRGCELVQMFNQRKIVLKKEVYQKAIETLYKVINYQIVKQNLNVEYAQKVLIELIHCVKKINFQVSNKIMVDVAQKSCQQIIQNQKLNFQQSEKKQMIDFISQE